MRILLAHSFWHPRGGDSTYTLALARRLQAAGHELLPYAMRHPDNEPCATEGHFPPWRDPEATPLAFAADMIWSRAAAAGLRGLIRARRPQIAHLQHVHRHLTPSLLDPLQEAGIPVLWTLHDYELVCPAAHLYSQGGPCEACRGHRYGQAVLRRCKRESRLASAMAALEKWAHQAWRLWERVDLFLCPSEHLRQTLLRFGLPAERLRHLPNLFDDQGWEPSEDPGQHLLCAARLVEPKGVDLAIEAARRAGLPLRIAGDGPERHRLEAQARGLPVTFLGQLSRAALREELRQARVVLVPSRWPENLPYAIIEAQALGRAVVASDLGGARELIEPGRSGLLVPAGDPGALAQALQGLMSSPERCQALGRAAARDTRERTSPSLHLTRLEALYQQLSRAP